MRMKWTLAAVLALLTSPALAQQPAACGDRESVVARLKEKFHESPTGFGMTGGGAVMELMTSDSGSWTLVLSFPGGRSCLIATGEQWELWRTAIKGKDA
ncbi:MAG: hypothetical protein L6R19_04135 [Alphaproteobacteria bacterium]|nr:hypothetical protein [Alphaproteobacteria bacterium]